MPKIWSGKWDGGRIYLDRRGGQRFVIERLVHGRRFNITLDAGDEQRARAELALFERDPGGYKTSTQSAAAMAADAVFLDTAAVTTFLAHLEKKGRTKRYRKNLRTYLTWWGVELFERDLRTVTLTDLKRALAKEATAEKNRIIAIKSFYSYLREVLASVGHSQDPTLSLKVPASRPERAFRTKGYTLEHVQKIYRHVADQSVRDVLVLHAKCGMHATEIDRLALGEGEIKALGKIDGKASEIAATIKFVHKSGRVHTQSIDAQTLAAARRLQERGAAPVDSWIRKVVGRAAKAAGVETLKLGEFRHSFVAWATTHGIPVRPAEGGVPLAQIAHAIGHLSATTTRRFYDVTEVPLMIKIPIILKHPQDPSQIPDGTLRNVGG